jgi:predicted GIY-YIG superfamily endonuclease
MGTQVTWAGQSGNTYTFNVHPLDSNFNEVECVYIYTKVVDKIWQTIYVGQTEHLATRLKEHENGDSDSDKCIRKSGATHIHVYQLKPKSSRLEVETDLRDNYKWSCNKQ